MTERPIPLGIAGKSNKILGCGLPILIYVVLAALAVPQPAKAQCQATELAELYASDAAPGDYLGFTVTASGDCAVFGSGSDCEDGDKCGAAYVFCQENGSWTQRAKLTASDAAAHDEGARWAAISGDIVVFGARLNDDAGSQSGAAYLFHRPAGGWSDMTETQKLTASDGTAGDMFGGHVAADGDVVLIGANRADIYGTDSGAAYVFRYDAQSQIWVEEDKLIPSDGAPQDVFGSRVAIQGDVAVVTAIEDDDHGGGSGSAYVFRYDPETLTWVQEDKLTADDGGAGDNFGYYVAISANIVVIGSWHDDEEGLTDSGSAYVFRYEGGNWVQEAKLIPSDAGAGDQFGTQLAVSGHCAVIGSQRDDDAGAESGSAYVFSYDASTQTWQEEAKLAASDGATWHTFGRSVGITGDTILIGASRDDDYGIDSGSVYVFRGLADCNTNGTLDICDIADGTSQDYNTNGIPDECENAPPIITCDGPVVLWSPDHELADVSSAITAEDPDGDDVTLSFRVFSDEPEVPETGDGTGRHAPDFKDDLFEGGRGLLVRSERRGPEDGRFYILLVTADDGYGGAATAVCQAAVVPHDQDQQSLDDVLTQAEAAASDVQAAVDSGGTLPPPALHEHGLSDPLGPKQ